MGEGHLHVPPWCNAAPQLCSSVATMTTYANCTNESLFTFDTYIVLHIDIGNCPPVTLLAVAGGGAQAWDLGPNHILRRRLKTATPHTPRHALSVRARRCESAPRHPDPYIQAVSTGAGVITSNPVQLYSLRCELIARQAVRRRGWVGAHIGLWPVPAYHAHIGKLNRPINFTLQVNTKCCREGGDAAYRCGDGATGTTRRRLLDRVRAEPARHRSWYLQSMQHQLAICIWNINK